MNILKNAGAVISGWLIGSMLNMGLITIGLNVISLPEGIDFNNIESISANFHLFEWQHFIFPFLAHALGTFVGAALSARFAVSHHLHIALCVGLIFMIGGIQVISSMGLNNHWFSYVDLIFAYYPMAYFGYLLIKKKRLISS